MPSPAADGGALKHEADLPTAPASGADVAWQRLANTEPEERARQAGGSFDASTGFYLLESFGASLRVDPAHRDIAGEGPVAVLVHHPLTLFRLAVPWYLVCAKDIPPTGRLVRPDNIPGGDIFARGTHVLPLDAVANTFGNDPGAFRARGDELGGMPASYGDVGVVLHPFPRLPVTMILWVEDDEFRARADLLFDSTAEFQVPVDVLWAVAMMTTGLLLGT